MERIKQHLGALAYPRHPQISMLVDRCFAYVGFVRLPPLPANTHQQALRFGGRGGIQNKMLLNIFRQQYAKKVEKGEFKSALNGQSSFSKPGAPIPLIRGKGGAFKKNVA